MARVREFFRVDDQRWWLEMQAQLEPMENRIMVKVLERENQGLSAIKYVVAIRSM